jgi:hypothetical protein
MVRCLALFALLVTTPAFAEDGPTQPTPVSARAVVTVTIVRGEEIGPVSRLQTKADTLHPAAPVPDRQYQRLPDDQIRIDFY